MQTSHGHQSSWQALKGKIATEVLSAPKTGGDPTGDWVVVHERVAHYLLRNVVGKSWADHLTLIAAVLSARRRDVHTVYLRVRGLNARFSALFSLLGLKHMEEWDVDTHLQMYLKGELSPKDSQITRYTFLKDYSSATLHVWNWYDALPEAEKEVYRRFVLPLVNPLQIEGLNKRNEIVEQQQLHRKTETAAVVPHYSALRAEAHFRYNRLARLRLAYHQAVERVLPDHSNLPLDFSYEEGNPPQERLRFKLWDRRSFVLDSEHAKLYHLSTYEYAKYGLHAFSEEQNTLFLEFIQAEQLEGDTPPEGFWFTELLTLGLLGMGARRGSDQQIADRQTWLRQWGYGEGTPEERITPFKTDTAGLLSWGDGKSHHGGGAGQFIKNAQKRTKGTLIPVESLYAAATFGLLALDLITVTGMRCGELMQVNLLPKCIVRLVDEPPLGAKDQSPRVRYLLRLLPKGERTETLHNYGIGKESMRLIERTAHMLCEHYQLQQGEPLPCVAFDPGHSRSHRFEQEKTPYLFQYNHQHLSDSSIAACLRFLIHGMVFQTSEGQSVVIKPHLLRHAFATFAVHVEGVSVDLVAKWLQQKNVKVTSYYSEMPEYMQVEQHASFVARMATQINIREAILRSPEEIAKQAEAARRRVGMLVPVAGGECMLDAYCPNQFDCIHCPAKAPDPEKRYQVEEKQGWATERLAYYEREGLVLEAEKMKQLLRACDLELKEMQTIIAYRKDETRVIQIQPRPKRPS